MKELKVKLAAAIANGREAIKAGELDKAKEYQTEAANITAQMEVLKSFDAMVPTADPAPMRPPMPGVGDGPIVKMQPDADPSEPVSTVKAFYVQKFGEPDAVVKSILTDLHGENYEAKYWQHKGAFRRYLRRGDTALSSEDRLLLHEVIMTPDAVKAALAQGVDDVSALKATMVEAVDTLGGYTVPVDFQSRVIARLASLTVVRPRATKVATSRDKVEMVKVTGGGSQYPSAVRVTWVDETPTAGTADTNLTFGLESIPIHTVMAETAVSRNNLEDSVFPLESYLGDKFAEAAAIDEDNRFLTGDGNGSPQGILPDSGNGLSLSYGYNDTSTTAVEWDGLINVQYSLDAQYRQNAAWIGEKATYKAIRKLKDGESRYLWQPDQREGQPITLGGFPVLEQEAMPTVGAGTFPMIFGDLGGYLIADRVGMTIERYLDSATARQNLVYFIMRRRLGGQVMESWRFVAYKIHTS